MFHVALLATVACAGCGESDARAGDAGTARDAAKATPSPEPGLIVGRVTAADGAPIATKGAKIEVSIYGVSDAGENVHFNPPIKPDGTYRQKVPAGSYSVKRATVRVPYNGDEFRFDLEPQGDQYDNKRDVADGIVQDFVWRLTGPSLAYKDRKRDPDNPNHWRGANVALQPDERKEGLLSVPKLPPAGTKLTFTLTPVPGTTAIDGTPPKPVTFERAVDPKAQDVPDLNDFVPGDYTLTGEATLPDGTKRPIQFSGKGQYPTFVKEAAVPLETEGVVGDMRRQSFIWSID